MGAAGAAGAAGDLGAPLPLPPASSLHSGEARPARVLHPRPFFAALHRERLTALAELDPRLVAPLRGLTLVPLTQSDTELCRQAADLTARAFAGLAGRDGRVGRPENLTLLAGVPFEELRTFFRQTLHEALEEPGAPSVVLLNQGRPVAAVIGQFIDPSAEGPPLPEGPLGEVFRVLGTLDARGIAAAKEQFPDSAAAPRWANLMTVAKDPSLPGNIAALAERAGVDPPDGHARDSLGIVRDLFDAAIVQAMSHASANVCFTVETVSPGSTRAVLGQNARPLEVDGRRFLWTPAYGAKLQDLFADAGATVSEASRRDHPQATADALDHFAQLWFGRATTNASAR